ncbi:MAG: hypothetical protein PHW33_02515 [Candidatus Portnoybacteria bacterium]|jgi:drug/metabolite transporter (DMT)-like permease|nr:hypothetical protein [Candidatus Portnoybacteria bacterium]
MSKTKVVLFSFLISFGIFFFVYGGYDDSPGAQLIGFLAVVGGVIGIIKSRKRKIQL